MAARAFFAVDFSDEVRRALSGAIRALPLAQASAKPVAMENLHVTLHFLGPIDDDRIMAAHEAGAAAAAAIDPFDIQAHGLQCVPPQGRLRMVWAGLADPTGGLADLHRVLGDRLAEADFDVDPRPFRPHVTLVRFRSGRGVDDVRAAVGAEADKGFGTVRAVSLVLYSSELTKAGPIYVPMSTMPLSG